MDYVVFPSYHQNWSKESTSGERPCVRSAHAACALSPTLLLVSGGWGGDGDFDDCWIFNLSTRTWTKVRHWGMVAGCHVHNVWWCWEYLRVYSPLLQCAAAAADESWWFSVVCVHWITQHIMLCTSRSDWQYIFVVSIKQGTPVHVHTCVIVLGHELSVSTDLLHNNYYLIHETQISLTFWNTQI